MAIATVEERTTVLQGHLAYLTYYVLHTVRTGRLRQSAFPELFFFRRQKDGAQMESRQRDHALSIFLV